ncbi:uncharacterized protein LOC108216827 [Daucus carota subsp. sativus]|uniref:Uncharacterized protein n=1 Tax=Daucus carota subsp. sativus TaxID=79200 RepID=A0A162AEP6_DAUCS|nr:PREDICTED: uncharacterized protein LOC108216827 [Daucus carota subsp. sativus]
MSAAQSIVHKFSIKKYSPEPGFQTFLFNPISETWIRRNGDKSSCITNRNIRYSVWQHDVKLKRNFVVCSNGVPPESSASSGGLPGGIPGSWKSWLLGIVVTVIIPLMTNKWGAILTWTKKIESAVQTVEDMVEAVEEIAEKVDKFTENIADDLPEGKLKETLEKIENVAERVAQDADRLDDMIDKVQEAEDKLEAYIEEEQNKSAAKKEQEKKS